MKSLLFLVAVGTSSVCVAAQPIIVEGSPLPSETVSYADLNLSSQEGVMRLKSRLSGAADRVCRTNNVNEVAVRVAGIQCYQAAVRDAYSQMDQLIAARASGTSLAAAAITVRGR